MNLSVCELVSLFRKFQLKGHKPQSIVSVSLFFKPTGEPMSQATLHADDNGVSAQLALKDKHGNTVTPATAPAWSLSDSTIVSMTVAPDGLSAQFAPLGPVGTTTVDVVVDGEAGPIHATGDIQVLAAGVATADLSFGPVT